MLKSRHLNNLKMVMSK